MKKESKKRPDYTEEGVHYGEVLFNLRIFYIKMLSILEEFFNKEVLITNEELNRVYVLLQDFVSSTLKLDDFKNLKKQYPDFFEKISLVGNVEDYGMEWEFLSKDAHEFLSVIEKDYALLGSPKFNIPKDLEKVFDYIDDVIKGHKLSCQVSYEKIIKEAKKRAEELSGQYNDDKIKIYVSQKLSRIYLDRETKEPFCFCKNKRSDLLRHFQNNLISTNKDIIAMNIYKGPTNEIRKLNIKLIDDLGLEYNLINELGKGSYQLNTKKYKIIFDH